jgi:hypothetical protein
MDSKVCKRCGNKKELSEFSKRKAASDGLHYWCKSCMSIYNKQFLLNKGDEYKIEKTENNKKWRKENPEKKKASNLRWEKNNPEKVKEMKERQKAYNRKNHKKVADRHRNYLNNNINARISDRLRSRLQKAIKRYNFIKDNHTLELIGCSIEELKKHLENQFVEGMNWNNYSKYGWHIDHIKPVALFNLSDPEEQKKCFHYTNLQPLWAVDNLSKGSKY